MALIYSPVAAYIFTAYTTYQSYEKQDKDLTISVAFFTGIAGDMFSDIKFIFLIYGVIPLFSLLPILYLVVPYKVLSSEREIVGKYRTLLLTLSLLAFYLFSRQFAYFIAISS